RKMITITTQAELDALPDSFAEYTRIYIKSEERIVVRKARGNSSVVAWGNSSVVARENSSVEARGNSSVVARENSSVVAWENSSVVAWGCVGVHLQSDFATVALFAFAVCWALAKGKIQKKSAMASIIQPIIKPGTSGWLENNCIEESDSVTLYKRVSAEFKTQEGTVNETLWAIGSVVEHPRWNPGEEECGAGKFHGCSRPYFADEFRSIADDRYVAIQVEKSDLYAWTNPAYPHKIAFRKGTVLYECDRFGKKISSPAKGQE